MKRITLNQLHSMAGTINELLNQPITAWSRTGESSYKANIGCFHLDGAYGGYALHRMMNESGGVEDIFGGHYTKRELYTRMYAYIRGIERAKKSEAA